MAWAREDMWAAIGLSLRVAALATALAMLLGTLAAAGLARTRFFGRDVGEGEAEKVLNPATGGLLDEVHEASYEQIHRATRACKRILSIDLTVCQPRSKNSATACTLLALSSFSHASANRCVTRW